MSLRFAMIAAAALTAACAPIPPLTTLPPAAPGATVGYASPKYSDGRRWLCRPDLPTDRCRVDLTTTEIHADGSRAVVLHPRPAHTKVDCFYVYPTVDLGVFPGNHTDFEDLEPMAGTTEAQVALLGEVCDLYVPLYRQITIGTYLFGEAQREQRLAVAFSDVADAFAHYLGQYNHGRPIVLIGHSQGAEMVARLLRRFFDDDPALRARLLVAMPIGGWVEVPRGRLTGGTFANIPVCTRPDELGCVVAFHTHRAGSPVSPYSWAPKPGNEAVCVNPASVDRNERRWFSGAYFPVKGSTLRELRGNRRGHDPVRGLPGALCRALRGGARRLPLPRGRGGAGDGGRAPGADRSRRARAQHGDGAPHPRLPVRGGRSRRHGRAEGGGAPLRAHLARARSLGSYGVFSTGLPRPRRAPPPLGARPAGGGRSAGA